MASRMPILRQDDMVKAFDKAIDDRHHAVAVSNRKRSARTKIILHVDDQQQIIFRTYRHFITPAGGTFPNLSVKRQLLPSSDATLQRTNIIRSTSPRSCHP